MGDLSLPSVDWFDAETTTFGDRVTGAREAAGMSQTELAKRLGVKVKTIRTWENDQSEPRANKLSMLAGLLGVSMMWLLSGQGDGLESPEENAGMDGGMEQLLLDIRQIRQEQTQLAERMGRIEKRLRAALSGSL